MLKLKKWISAFLSIAILVAPINISTFAKEATNAEEKSFGRTDLNILIETDNYMEYTYQESGKHYMIKEEINIEKNTVYSEVFVQNTNGEYELEDTYLTQISSNSGETRVSVKSNDQLIESYSLFEGDIETLSSVERATPPPPADGEAGWVHAATIKGSTKIYNLTISGIKLAITKSVNAIVSAYFSKPVGKIAETITKIATSYFLKKADYAYMKNYVFYYFPKGSKIPTRGRNDVMCYANSAYSEYLGNVTEEYAIILGGN